MNHSTEQEYAEVAAEIFHAAANVTPADVLKARKYLESCMYTTAAVGALVLALRQQYAEHRELGCNVVEGDPCAEALVACLVPIANLEAREV